MATNEATQELKIIRIAGTDIYGDKNLVQGLVRIKGISHMFANAISKTLEIPKNKKFGNLSEDEISSIKDFIENPSKYKLPIWMLNRRKDFDTGVDRHITSTDVDFTNKMDIRRLQEVKTRRGLRHSYGLKVRGQRLKSNARKGKTVGVKKKSGAKKGK